MKKITVTLLSGFAMLFISFALPVRNVFPASTGITSASNNSTLASNLSSKELQNFSLNFRGGNPLAGDYVISSALFNQVTGLNITFEERTRMVEKDLPEENKSYLNVEDKNSTAIKKNQSVIAEFMKTKEMEIHLNTATHRQAVEETYSVPMANGVEYTGSFFHEITDQERKQYNIPDFISSQLYATLTAAVSDLNLRGAATDVNFLLTESVFSSTETFPIIINTSNSPSPASSSAKVTIRPNTGMNLALTGSVNSGPLIEILNTSYVTIDGSNDGSGSKNLTIGNTSSTYPNVVWIGSSGNTPVTNDCIKNCNINNGSQTSTAILIGDGITAGDPGYFNNISIQNNTITKSYVGVYAYASTSPNNGSGFVCSNNDLSTSGSNAIRRVGIYVQGIDGGATVSNNTIGNFESTFAETDAAIFFAGSTSSGTISGNTISNLIYNGSSSPASTFGIITASETSSAGISILNNSISGISTNGTGISDYASGIVIASNFVTASGNTISNITSSKVITATGIIVLGNTSGANINKNSISNIKNTFQVGYGSQGILLGSTSISADIEVSSNLIFDIASYGFAGNGFRDNGYGIDINQGAGYSIYSNSINMNSDQTRNTGNPAAINIESNVNTNNALNIRNNIFYNSQTFGRHRYAIYSGADKRVFSDIDYNLYYTVEGTAFGYLGGNITTLANWKTSTGKDSSSISGIVPFKSSTNLAIDLTSSNAWNVKGMGIQITTVTTGYSGAPRPTTVVEGAPSIGAYNVGTISAAPPIAAQTGTLSFGNSTSYSVAGKTLATVDWINPDGNGINPPAQLNAQYFGGTYPPNSNGGVTIKRANCYWVFTAIGGNIYNYNITIHYDKAALGDITSENKVRVAKSETGSDWINYGGTPDETTHSIIIPGLSSFSFFTLTDNDAPLPVELVSFTSTIDHRNVELKWSTANEQNNAGFDIEKRIAGSDASWSKVGNVVGHGTSSVTNSYSFKERNLPTANYIYRLKQMDNNGNFKYYLLANEVIIGLPVKFSISQNYPNPFNPTTKINYDLPVDSKVSIVLFDMTGRQVAEILNTTQQAGYQTVQFNASNLSSGTYFYQITVNGGGQSYAKTLKMMLVK
ncbi:hypothetical protein BH10BAC5_BH10BAC5_20150 [soil metagenome]